MLESAQPSREQKRKFVVGTGFRRHATGRVSGQIAFQGTGRKNNPYPICLRRQGKDGDHRAHRGDYYHQGIEIQRIFCKVSFVVYPHPFPDRIPEPDPRPY